MGVGRGVGLMWCVSERNRLQCSHIRGVPGESMEKVGHGKIVAARVYQSCCRFAVGRGLASEC